MFIGDKKLSQNLCDFSDYFCNNYEKESNNKDFEELQKFFLKINDLEERIFFIFLATHFDSVESAKNLYVKLSWKDMLLLNYDLLFDIVGPFFNTHHRIGDHRRFFNCKKDKIQFTCEVLQTYKEFIGKYGSQNNFFKTGDSPIFDILYNDMSEIKSFERRLPRFEHLERMSLCFNFYLKPQRFYIEDSSGPLDGLYHLLFKKKPKAKDLSQFLGEWNKSETGMDYTISLSIKKKELFIKLEQWLIKTIKERQPDLAKKPDFIFNLESCLCNWQKGREYGS